MYKLETIFQVQFCIHSLSNVLIELNTLNQRFQEYHVNIIYIGTTLDVTINKIHKPLLEGISGAVAMHTFIEVSKFSKDTKIRNTRRSHSFGKMFCYEGD